MNAVIGQDVGKGESRVEAFWDKRKKLKPRQVKSRRLFWNQQDITIPLLFNF